MNNQINNIKKWKNFINENLNEPTTEDIELRSKINNIVYKRTSYIKNSFGSNERVIKELDAVKLIDDIFNMIKGGK